MSAPDPSDAARQNAWKAAAAEEAVKLVRSGMRVGLGAGSTATLAIRRIGALVQSGQLRDLLCVPCSAKTHALAEELGLLVVVEDAPALLDITLDGADEVDPQMDLIKGGGGALLREKVVAEASRREVILVDESKLSPALGTRWAVPVEVLPLLWRSQAAYLEGLGARISLRAAPGGAPFRTDQGAFILDCTFGPIPEPAVLARALEARAGIIAHGLFLGLATDLVVAGPSGIRHLTR